MIFSYRKQLLVRASLAVRDGIDKKSSVKKSGIQRGGNIFDISDVVIFTSLGAVNQMLCFKINSHDFTFTSTFTGTSNRAELSTAIFMNARSTINSRGNSITFGSEF
jgi:hypothetical protein